MRSDDVIELLPRNSVARVETPERLGDVGVDRSRGTSMLAARRASPSSLGFSTDSRPVVPSNSTPTDDHDHSRGDPRGGDGNGVWRVDDLWGRLGALTRTTLYGGGSHSAFTIDTIREDSLTIRTASGRSIVIPRTDLEQAERLGLSGRALSNRALVEAGLDPQRAPYLVGILRALSYLSRIQG